MLMRRIDLLLVIIITATQMSGCASPKQRSEAYEAALGREIYAFDAKAAEYEEMGNTEMARYHREMADENRKEYAHSSDDPSDLFFDFLFDGLLSLFFE
jgi:uncharacterized protein YceK